MRAPAESRGRAKVMSEAYPGAGGFIPDSRSLRRLAAAATGCHGCDLYEAATQTVFGRGPKTARLMLVGEQPGDVEDREGVPFVGPAGRLLDKALISVGLDRSTVYSTNAVKHFRWRATDRGSRRIHQKPSAAQVKACRPWLDAELSIVRPAVIVALGAVAAQELLGPEFRVTKSRGTLLPWPPDRTDPKQLILATVHPSAVLRADDRSAALAGLVADLRVAADAVRDLSD
jgi:uracil-DNA glycosylase family protein